MILLSLFASMTSLKADHRANKYFPASEQTDQYTYSQEPRLFSSAFFTTTEKSFSRGKGYTDGTGNLYGMYDLQKVIDSVNAVYGSGIATPLRSSLGTKFANVPLKFIIGGKVTTSGLNFGYDLPLGWQSLTVGFKIPVMQVFGTERYGFDQEFFSDATNSMGIAIANAERATIRFTADQTRRKTHDTIKIFINDWQQNTLGDLDCFVRWNYFADHQLLMKSINVNVQAGATFPTSSLTPLNRPAAIPCANNGHLGMYYTAAPEFELKQDIKVGFLLSGIYLFDKEKTARIPVLQEPSIFSALEGRALIKPGVTARIAPYLTLENLIDGLNIQARYTYSRHTKDTIEDKRDDKTIPSYLTQTASNSLTADTIAANIARKEYLSSWRSHYLTLTVSYNTKEALQKTLFSPTFYTEYNFPLSGRGTGETYQVGCGMALRF